MFRYLHYRCEGPKSLECACCFPMLFVLHGALEMRFKYSSCAVDAGNMVVVNTEMLSEYHTSEHTVVLVYTPPKRLSEFFDQSSRLFDSSFSDIVPILPPLQEWIGILSEECRHGRRWTSEDEHVRCRELASILMTYSHRVLGELFAPFSVCAMGDCERCRE